MKKSFFILTGLILSLVLSSCATQPLKAPCNESAVLCGTKHKINE